MDFPDAFAGLTTAVAEEVGTSSAAAGGITTSNPISPLSSNPRPSTTSTTTPLELPGATAASARNPRIQHTRGILHLYRSSSSTPASSYASAVAATSSSSSGPTPRSSPPTLYSACYYVDRVHACSRLVACLSQPWRGTRLLVFAVPTRVSSEDFVRFCGPYVEHASDIRVISDDGVEDWYSVLVEFEDQKSADGFYLDLNGWRFSSSEIVDEYNRLLASQLEAQREYYEALLSEAKKEKERHISVDVDKAINDRFQEVQLKRENIMLEKKKVAEMNEKLTKSQDIWLQTVKGIEERERA